MTDIDLLLLTPFIIAPVFVVAWLWQLRTKNAGWVDVFWSFGVALTGVFYGLSGSGDLVIRVIVGSIYGIWFSRLTWHLLQRVKGEPEDGRYKKMRSWAGGNAWLLFLLFYLMQASWVWVFTLPAWLLSGGVTPPVWAIFIALVIVIVAWAGESIADHQLHKFRSDPANKGKTCRLGLWRYSRHPNYFFEWCHWLAYPILGIGVSYGGWLWLAPVVMFVFLYFITGIPFTEQQALRSRGDDYRHYQQTTSMFIPWKPKA